ncbi:MAG: TetR family transcriptional regulator [Spirochaetota bacterium]|nr:TetR family transcriptional regulator [Spirochaetota bacterium]
MGITKENIVQASIRILNREGIGGLSMRTIARELGIKAASLYSHISGKAELYNEIAEYMCKDFAMPDASLPPEEYLIAMAISYRAMLLTVRDSAVIFGESFPVTPLWTAISKSATGHFMLLGIGKKNFLTATSLYNNYVLAFVADETRTKNRTPDEARLSESVFGFGELLTLHGRHFDEQFLFGLRVLFRGLEAMAGEGRQAGPRIGTDTNADE